MFPFCCPVHISEFIGVVFICLTLIIVAVYSYIKTKSILKSLLYTFSFPIAIVLAGLFICVIDFLIIEPIKDAIKGTIMESLGYFIILMLMIRHLILWVVKESIKKQ